MLYIHLRKVPSLSYNPQSVFGFGLFPLRSPLLRKSQLLSFPPSTEMFHFLGFGSRAVQRTDVVGLPQRVSPFGNPRIDARLTAPRGLSQPCHVLLSLLMSRHPPYTLNHSSFRFWSVYGYCIKFTCESSVRFSHPNPPILVWARDENTYVNVRMYSQVYRKAPDLSIR